MCENSQCSFCLRCRPAVIARFDLDIAISGSLSIGVVQKRQFTFFVVVSKFREFDTWIEWCNSCRRMYLRSIGLVAACVANLDCDVLYAPIVLAFQWRNDFSISKAVAVRFINGAPVRTKSTMFFFFKFSSQVFTSSRPYNGERFQKNCQLQAELFADNIC